MLRTCVLSCALAAAVGLSIGCSKDNKTTQTKKEEALTAHKARLSELDKQIDELKAKMEKATGDEKAQTETKYKDVMAKRDAIKKKLDEFEKAAADKWEAVNKELEAAFEEIKKAVN